MKDDKKNFYSALIILLLIVAATLALVFFPPESVRHFWGKNNEKQVGKQEMASQESPALTNQEFLSALDNKLEKCAQAQAVGNKSASFSMELARFACLRNYLANEDLDIKSDICSRDKYFSEGDFYGRAFCYASLAKNTDSSWEKNCQTYAVDMEKKGMDGGQADSFDRCVFAYLSYQPRQLSDELCGKMKTKKGKDNCLAMSKSFQESKSGELEKNINDELTNCLGRGGITNKNLCSEELVVKNKNPFVCLVGEKIFGLNNRDCFIIRNQTRRDLPCLSRDIQALFDCVGK